MLHVILDSGGFTSHYTLNLATVQHAYACHIVLSPRTTVLADYSQSCKTFGTTPFHSTCVGAYRSEYRGEIRLIDDNSAQHIPLKVQILIVGCITSLSYHVANLYRPSSISPGANYYIYFWRLRIQRSTRPLMIPPITPPATRAPYMSHEPTSALGTSMLGITRTWYA